MRRHDETSGPTAGGLEALRDALEPADPTVERVVAAALRGRRRSRRPAGLAAAALALAGLTLWILLATRPPQSHTTLESGPGGIVILRTAQGGAGFYSNARAAGSGLILIRRGGSS